jgi:hypothetical protein
MRIAIIGTGNVGGALARAWARCGREIVLGARDASSDKVTALLSELGDKATAASIAEAAQNADVIVLAAAWQATEEIIKQLGDLRGRVVIDTNNPLLPGLAGLSVGTTDSAAEHVARWAAGAHVVKAFNHIGAAQMGAPQFGEQTATIFICGDDTAAKETVAGLVRDIGFDVVDAGPLTAARLLEPLALLWIRLVYMQGLGDQIAFKLLRR